MALLKVEAGAESRDVALPSGGEMLFLSVNGQPKNLQLTTERPDRYLAALLYASRHWLVLTPPGGGDVAIDGVPVPGLKILDDTSLLTAGGFRLRLQERVEEVLTADAPVIAQKKLCPYCQTQFAANDRVIYCPTCGLAHHDECLQRGDRCGSYPFCGYTVPKKDVAKADVEKADRKP